MNMSTQSERVVSDVKELINDTEELVKATASQAGEKVAEIRARAQNAVNDLKPKLATIEAEIVNKAKIAATATDTYIHQNPWTAIGVAAGIGLVIGLLIGRR
jgi:ElaB/YqjD/DUF883 family membrane-anchored ribosome-binding protein